MKANPNRNGRVALAVWNGRISPVFDVARRVELLDLENGRVTARREEPLPGAGPQSQAGRIAELGPRVLICGAVSRPMAALLLQTGIQLIPFMGGNAQDVIMAWMEGGLEEFRMPGCCGRRGCRGWQRKEMTI